MKKIVLPLLGAFEIIRLVFLLSLHAKFEIVSQNFGWYITAPLLGIPFLLLFIAYKSSLPASEDEIHFNENNQVKKIIMQIYAIQKAATTTGFAFFAVAYIQNLSINILSDGLYFIKILPFMVIFFTIDVILCITIILKQEKKSEG